MNSLIRSLCLLALTCGLCSSMTVKTNNTDQITGLPGLNFTLPFNQFSGYLDGGDGNMLHYWFVEAEGNATDAPLLLWLNGGPGCSSLDGMLNELGPLHVMDDGKTLYQNHYSWNTFAHVLFLESPACVGFSYSTKGSCEASDDSTSLANYRALKSFYEKYPQYKETPFFVTGESYAGIYVPTLSVRIVEGNHDYPINFQGFAVGNGLSSWEMNDDSLIFFANYHGLLGQVLWDSLVDSCCDSDIPSRETCHFSSSSLMSCQVQVKAANDIIGNSGLNIYNLYGDCLHPDGSNTTSFSRYHADKMLLHKNLMHSLGPSAKAGLDPPCTDSTAMSTYLNNKETRKALHIPDNVPEWSICNDEVNANFHTQYASMTDQYKKLHSAGVRGLVYNGDVDMACNFIGDQWFVESLELKEIAVRRPWYSDQQVGGFVKRFEKLDLLTVRGSGHMVPQDKPAASLKMINSFVLGKPY